MKARLLLAVPLCIVAQAQSLQVQGTLLGQDGKPMALAHARLLSLDGGSVLSAVQVDATGHFLVHAEAKGYLRLQATGVGHQVLDLMLPADGRSLTASIRLTSDAIRIDKPAAVEVAPNGKLGGRTTLLRQADGSWSAAVPASGAEFRYEVAGASANGHTINGTAASRYEYDGDSDYLSVAAVKDGTATVAFDPKRFPETTAKPSIAFDGEAVLNRFAAVSLQRADLDARTMAALLARKPGETAALPPPEPLAAVWQAQLKTEADPLTREALWLALSQFGPRGMDFSGLPQGLPADSPFFISNPQTAMYAPLRMAAGPARDAYQAAIFRAVPDASASRFVQSELGELIYEGKAAEAKAKLATFEASRPGLPIYAKLASDIEATSKVSVGAPVPDFRIADLEDGKNAYSPAAFKGKYLLLDFWATWCGPCRAEMPKLHEAYASFHPRGLEVLSLSFDLKAGDVAPYRRDPAHAMPWHHAFVERGFQSELAKAFAVTGIPKPILVGPDGKIVAMGESLRGEGLAKTLAALLPGPAAGAN